MFRPDFRKKGICSKFVTKKLYQDKVLVSEPIFKLFCHRKSCGYQRLVVWKTYRWNIDEQTLLLLILKSSHRSCCIKKDSLKSFIGKHLYQSLFSIKLQVAGLRTCNAVVSQRRCFPLKFAKFLRTFIFKNTCIFM